MSSAPRSETAFTAATIVWPSAHGINLRETAREMKFKPKEAAHNPPLAELLQLDDTGFRARFKGSPIKRIGRDRFVRNVLVAAGNSGDESLLQGVVALLGDASPLVRGMAVWASAQACKRGPRIRAEREIFC